MAKMKVILSLLLVANTCSGLSVTTTLASPKSRLQDIFQGKADDLLVDPKTKQPLVASRRLTGSSVQVVYESNDERYGRRGNGAYLDLVAPLSAPSLEKLRQNAVTAFQTSSSDIVKVQTFRSPLTAFLYERGWRDSFVRNGFPGPDQEFAEFKEFAQIEETEKTVLDLSCGTGLFTRRIFTATPPTTRLIAADYSEAMLLEANRRFRQSFGNKQQQTSHNIDFIRVDVAHLPFADNSIDAIHCGAALHCYPDVEAALKEIFRVLKPDGAFFATTFLKGAMGTATSSSSSALSFFPQRRDTGFRFFSLDELEQLTREAAFADVHVRRQGSYCAIIKCRPSLKGTLGIDDDGVDNLTENEAPLSPSSFPPSTPTSTTSRVNSVNTAAAVVTDIPSA